MVIAQDHAPFLTPRMRVGIDARSGSVGASQYRGIGTYITKLVEALQRQGKHKYIPYICHPAVSRLSAQVDRWISGRLAYWFEQTTWLASSSLIKYQAIWDALDVFHSTDPLFILPTHKHVKTVATFHDPIPLLYPEKGQKSLMNLNRHLYHRSLEALMQINHIITPTHAVKADLMRLLAIPQHMITPVHHGVDPRFQPFQDQQAVAGVLARYGIPSRYILYVGGVDYRKNILLLMDAFSDLVRRRNEKTYLVLVGSDLQHNRRLRQQFQLKVDELGLRQSVIMTGFVPLEELVALYNGADLFVFPSLYEGFGLPVLEAMACGTPVVASTTPALAEITAGAAYSVDPSSREDILEGMWAVLSDEGLRASLRKKGLQQALRFRWELSAEQTRQVYERITA